MTTPVGSVPATGPRRDPAVAGSFYPGVPEVLEAMVRDLFDEAAGLPRPVARPLETVLPAGLLVPHAGLAFSGIVAAAAWATMRSTPRTPAKQLATVVLLGTNHRAAWLDGVAAWTSGAWRTPLGDVLVDGELAAAIVGLGPPFHVDLEAHAGEHSIEVQLPLLREVAPGARVVPLAVEAGTGPAAIEAGRRLGELLGRRRLGGRRITLAISSDMAHYPPADACEAVTAALLPPILGVDAAGLAGRESAIRSARLHGMACGMCGIQPAVLGLAALRAMGVRSATRLASATSADAGGPPDRTVGYLAVRFDD